MPIKLDSVLREFDIVPRSTEQRKNFVFDCYAHDATGTPTRFSRYIEDIGRAWKNTVIVMGESEVIGSGEDPRPFFWRGSPCISAQTFHPAQHFINKIYVKTLRKWFTLIAPVRITPGKNWAPFVFDDELYFVHEYAPFRVLKAEFVSEHDDFMVLETVAEHPIELPASFDGYSWLRGGANAVQIGDAVLGIGHTNERPDQSPKSITHRPFVFVYQPGISVSYHTFDYDFPDTYRIVDPTSLYLKDDVLHLVTCETQYAWNVPDQTGRICRYTINIKGKTHEDSFGIGGRRLYRWSHDDPPAGRGFLATWRRRLKV